MVIKKLNSLFYKHSRLLFGVFTVLIIVAFTDFLTPGRGGGCGGGENTAVGTAFGSKVTYGELAAFGRDVSVSLLLRGGSGNLPGNVELFNYYCVIQRAKQLGLTATESEIAARLIAIPAFQKAGKFDAPTFDRFLKARNLSESELNRALALAIIEEKLALMLPSLVTVTDAEAETWFRLTRGGCELKVCRFDAKNFSGPTPDAKKLQDYYRTHREKYVVPGSFEALLAAVPFKPFEAEATKGVTDAAVAQAAAGGMYVGMDGKPLNAAAIRKDLIQAKSAELAARAANKLFRDLYRRLGDLKEQSPAAQLKLFRDWAAANKLTVVETGKVPFGQEMLGDRYLPALSRELQSMSGKGMRLTAQASAQDAVCIAMLKDRTEPRRQTLNEAANAVRRDYIADQQLTLARDFAKRQAADLAKQDKAAAGKAFDRLKGTFATLRMPPQPDAKLAPELLEAAYALAQQLPELGTGAISGAVDTATGAAIAKVLKRQPADMSKFPEQKLQIRNELFMLKRQQFMQQFMEEIARQCRCTLPEAQAERE